MKTGIILIKMWKSTGFPHKITKFSTICGKVNG